MPTYSYKCSKDGYFDLQQDMVDHAKGVCPTCGSECSQVLLSAPTIDLWAMAKAGFPGAHETVGNRMTKRHQRAGQSHTASEGQMREEADRDLDLHRNATVS